MGNDSGQLSGSKFLFKITLTDETPTCSCSKRNGIYQTKPFLSRNAFTEFNRKNFIIPNLAPLRSISDQEWFQVSL